MVKNVIQAVYREVRGLHEAAYVLALFAFGSQLLALIRDRLLAHTFGAGHDLDLYYAAFRIPDLLYVIFASTLSVYVLIPFVADRITGTDTSRARAFLSEIFTLFLVGYTVLAGTLAFFAPFLVELMFPGFAADSTELTNLIRILLLQPFFLGISSLFGVITQFSHRFILFAISPLLYNLGIICGLIFLYPILGVQGLIIGVVLGALGHVSIQIPFVQRSDLTPKLTWNFTWVDIRSVLSVSVVRALTLSLHQIVLLVLIGVASIMSLGSVSVFQFAFNLQSVPLTIIGVSYSVAAFPLLARLFSEQKLSEFAESIMTALRHIIFWSVPAIALIVVIRAQVVRTVLGTGAFDWDDTKLTAAVFALFGLSLTSQAVHLLLVRAYYASGNTILPFFTTLTSSVCAVFFSMYFYVLFSTNETVLDAFEQVMRLEGVPGTEVLALPLGYSVGLMIDSVLLLWCSRRRLGLGLQSLTTHFLSACMAATVALVFSYLTLNGLATVITTDTLIGIFAQGFISGCAGIFGAFLIYATFRSPELSEVYRSLKRRIQKSDVIVPQDEDTLSV
jgi:putative peptidoglycan lipid II flippase